MDFLIQDFQNSKKYIKIQNLQKLSASTVISHPATSTNTDTNMNISTPDNNDPIPVISNPKLPALFAQLLKSRSCGLWPQQIMCSLWLLEIFS